ncbi:MAG: hypothetical protein WEE89_00160, partial [Gemmatimonadota bacterium]
MRAMVAFVIAAVSATGLTAQTTYMVSAPHTRAVQAVAEIPTIPTIPTIPFYFTQDQQETAASLFQQGVRELNRQNYERASDLFERLIERYSRTTQAGDAHYWQAWALHKMSGSDNLENAIELLDEQKRRYPNAATRQQAEILLVNIRGALARRGDSDAAEQVARSATAASRQQCPSRDDEEMRAAALNAVLQMDAENAMPLLKKVMSQRDACYAE